jgi:endonuclease/exonuclease/phosphatase family metal-dependent hydrolase
VFDTIRKYGGDFIGLQEVIESQLKELGEELSGYKCIGEARHDRSYANPLYNEWNPICYKTALWKVDPVENGTFWLSETPDVLASKSWGSSLPRICTWAKFTHRKTGKSLYIYNTHYDQVSQEARINSSKLILKRMSQRKSKESPVFLMGDLNAGENSDSVQLLTSTPIDKNKNDLLLDTFRHLYPNAGKTGTYNYWIGFKLGPKVDYIFGLSSQKSRIISAKILHHHTGGHYPSDHFPVIASINFD